MLLWTNAINDLSLKEIVGTFYKERTAKKKLKKFIIEQIREKAIIYMLNGKGTIICLIDG